MSNTVTKERLLTVASVTSAKVKSSEYIDNKPYYYWKSGTRKTRDSFKAASFDIVGVSKFTVDECRTAGYFGGLKLEIKDKDGDTIDWNRLTDEQGVPLIYVIY